MKLQTLGKIQIGIGLTLFLALLITNIFVYFSMMNVISVPMGRTSDLVQNSNVSNVQNIVGFFVIFTEILIVGDIIILLFVTTFILDGAAMLSKN